MAKLVKTFPQTGPRFAVAALQNNLLMVKESEGRPQIESIYGILPDWALGEYIRRGLIKIEPLSPDWEEKLGPVSIDFHLGEKILVPKIEPHIFIDVKRGVERSHYDEVSVREGESHILMPDQFIITAAREHLELPNDIIGHLQGKSSLARIGIVVHLSSGRFDPGWSGHPVLELKNNSKLPIILYGGWPICAFSFERIMSAVERPYSVTGRYRGGTIHSLIDLDNGG